MADRAVPGLHLRRGGAYAVAILLLLLLLVPFLISPCAATVYTWDGKNATTSVQDLINATVNGDSIYLTGGRYTGNLQINRSIVFGALDTADTPEIVSTNASAAGITLLSDGIAINGLIISGEADTGLLIKSGNNQIRGMTIRGFRRGIGLSSAQSNILSGNTVVNNSLGIGIERTSRSNTFYLNFFNNTRDVESPSAENMWSSGRQVYMYAGREYTGQVGNYWAGYSGKDENGDGIGDTPYEIQEDVPGDLPAEMQGGAPQGIPGQGLLFGVTDRAPLVALPASYTLVSVAGRLNATPAGGEFPQKAYQPVSGMMVPEGTSNLFGGPRNPYVAYLIQYWWIVPIALIVSVAGGIWFGRRWKGQKHDGTQRGIPADTSRNVTVVKKTLPPPDAEDGVARLHYAARLPPALEKRYPDAQYLAEGGVSRVFRAWDEKEGRPVAVKIPIRFDEVTGTQFTKELHVWEGLHHTNIVEIYAANIFPVPYIEMEYVPSSLSGRKFPLGTAEAVAIIRGVAEGLRYAHEQGIVHRDIKPANIMIGEDGTPKISDWGLSKAEGTKQSGIIGFSLEYAAPEQLAPNLYGEPGPRTDIYQLGVLFYEMLAGHIPFPGGGLGEITQAILHDPPRPLVLSGPDADLITGIIMKCLAKRPEDRYESVSRFLDELKKAGS